MIALLDQAAVDRIGRQAREASPGRTAATVAVSVLFGLGWLVARVLGLAWLAVAWAGIAVREGWRAGRTPEWQGAVRAREVRRARAGRAGPG